MDEFIDYNPENVLGPKARIHISAYTKLIHSPPMTLTPQEIDSLDYKWIFSPQSVQTILLTQDKTYTQTILEWWAFSPLITHFLERDWYLDKKTIQNIVNWKLRLDGKFYEKFRDVDDAIGMTEGISSGMDYEHARTQLYDERRNEDLWYETHFNGLRNWKVGGEVAPYMKDFMDIVFDRPHIRHTEELHLTQLKLNQRIDEWSHMHPLPIIQQVKFNNRIYRKELQNPLKPPQIYDAQRAPKVIDKEGVKFVNDILRVDPSGTILQDIAKIIGRINN